jgi:arabinofuranan 3-O-arabinosyltransferase
LAVWYAVQISALVVSVVLLRRIWDPARTWLGLLVLLAMFLAWHATQLTLLYAQTNFLILLGILGVVLLRSPFWRGIALGLAIVVKPIAAILVIDLALRRQWRSLLAMLVPPLVGLAMFLLLQGWPGLVRYLERDPRDIVFEYYNGPFNQSLMAVLLRWFESPPLARPILFPPYVVLAGILTATTVLVVARLPKHLAPLGIGYVLTLALLVYPGTQMYYSVWLLVPLLLAWRERRAFRGGSWVVPLMIAIAFGLGWSRWNCAAHLVTWLALTALLCSARLRERERENAEKSLSANELPAREPAGIAFLGLAGRCN